MCGDGSGGDGTRATGWRYRGGWRFTVALSRCRHCGGRASSFIAGASLAGIDALVSRGSLVLLMRRGRCERAVCQQSYRWRNARAVVVPSLWCIGCSGCSGCMRYGVPHRRARPKMRALLTLDNRAFYNWRCFGTCPVSRDDRSDTHHRESGAGAVRIADAEAGRSAANASGACCLALLVTGGDGLAISTRK